MTEIPYKVMLGQEIRGGVFEYSVQGLSVSGQSREPMLDACRQIKSLGGDTAAEAYLFRPGKSEPDLIANVGRAAELTVIERASRPKFEKWKPFQKTQ